MHDTAIGIPKHWMNRGFGKELEYFFQGSDHSSLFKRKELLELGSGFGKTLRDLVDAYGCQAKGIDLQEVSGVPHAEGLDLTVGDIQCLPYADNSFDTVFSYWTFQYVDDKLKGLAEAHRVLKPGGTAVIDLGDVEFQGSDEVSKYISPSLAEILEQCPNEGQININNGYQGQSWISIPRDGAKRGEAARRCQRAIIHKTGEEALVFPDFVRSEDAGENFPYKKSIYSDV